MITSSKDAGFVNIVLICLVRLAASKSSVINMELESDIIMISAECCSNDFNSFAISDKNGKERMNSLICVGLTYSNKLLRSKLVSEDRENG